MTAISAPALLTDRLIDGPGGPVPVRVYAPTVPGTPEVAAAPRGALVWLHGGGFIGGDLDMPEADRVSRLFAGHGILTVSVDYRLAPWPAGRDGFDTAMRQDRAHFPAGLDDAVAAFSWARSESGLFAGPWSLGGASAGGNLAAATVLRLLTGGTPPPATLLLAYPTLHVAQPPHGPIVAAALTAHPEHDTFTPPVIAEMYAQYVGDSGAIDPFVAPGDASDDILRAFPPTIVDVDEWDALRTSGDAFAERLAAVGVDVTVSVAPEQPHGHLNHADAEAVHTVDRFAAHLLTHSTESPSEGTHS